MKKTTRILTMVLPMLLCAFSSTPSLAEEGRLTGSITGGGAVMDVDVKNSNKDRSYKFGEYSGITQDGYGIGDFDLSYEGKNNFYVDFLGKDLGWDSRYLSLSTGWHGGYELSLEYDQIPHYVSNDSKTIYDGVGGNNLTLPAGFTRGEAGYTGTSAPFNNNAAAFATSLTTYARDINIKTERKGGTVTVSAPFMSVFDFDLSYKREDKDGLKYVGGVFGTSGGDRRSIALPEPVDYSTDELNLSLGYLGEKVQVNLSYYFSNFDNKYANLMFANPWQGNSTRVSGAYSGVYYYGDTGQLAMDPDNEHHRVSLSGAVDLPMSSRLTLLGEYGQMDQNQALLPYTINPNTVITHALPRSSAMGEIETYHFIAGLNSKPIENLDVDVKYKFYQNDNNTPIDVWLKADNDNTSVAGRTATSPRVGQTWEENAKAVYNVPFDYQQNRVDVGLSYNIHHESFVHTVLKTGYAFEQIRRSYRESDSTEENSFWAGLRSRFASYGQTNLNYTHAVRKNSGYNTLDGFAAVHTGEHLHEELVTYPNTTWDNHPLLRKYDQADRVRDKVGASLSITPHEMIVLGAHYSYAYDDYTNSVLGLRAARNSSWTLDMNYTPTPAFTFFTYYTREDINADQASWRTVSNTSNPNKYTVSQDLSQRWWAKHEDSIDTWGIGSEYRMLEDKLTLRSDVSYSDAKSMIEFTTGGNAALLANSQAPMGMPAMASNIASLILDGNYRLTPNWGVGAGYRFEHYGSDDWATDGVNPMTITYAQGGLGDVITMTSSIPDYHVHMGSIYITYYFNAK